MCTALPALSLIIVDDDEHIRRAVGRLLRAHGHEVQSFGSAEACLADAGAADCAIVDVDLPGMNGLELDDRLREQGRGIPAVFITAHDEVTIFEAAYRKQRPLLKKPVDEESLLAAIAAVTSCQDL